MAKKKQESEAVESPMGNVVTLPEAVVGVLGKLNEDQFLCDISDDLPTCCRMISDQLAQQHVALSIRSWQIGRIAMHIAKLQAPQDNNPGALRKSLAASIVEIANTCDCGVRVIQLAVNAYRKAPDFKLYKEAAATLKLEELRKVLTVRGKENCTKLLQMAAEPGAKAEEVVKEAQKVIAKEKSEAAGTKAATKTTEPTGEIDAWEDRPIKTSKTPQEFFMKISRLINKTTSALLSVKADTTIMFDWANDENLVPTKRFALLEPSINELDKELLQLINAVRSLDTALRGSEEALKNLPLRDDEKSKKGPTIAEKPAAAKKKGSV